MALQYGFFNSVSGDRKYNADSFNNFFEGLISANGIFENVGERFAVSAGTGLSVNVGTGKAMVNSCWAKNDATITLTVDNAHNLLPRYDVVYLQYNASSRDITLGYRAGTPASTPVKPTPTRSATTYEIFLAYIYVAPNATNLTAANIQDCRYNTKLCGVITGLIKQVDTSTLYNQYLTKFNELVAMMDAWKTAQQNAYDEWFNGLTSKLNVNTYITRNVETVFTTEDNTHYIEVPESLNYEEGDVLDIFVGGVLFVEDLDYELIKVNNVLNVNIYFNLTKNQPVTFYNIKSKIGDPATSSGTNYDNVLVASMASESVNDNVTVDTVILE